MSNNNTNTGFFKGRPLRTATAVILVVILGIGILWLGKSKTNNEPAGEFSVFTAKRGPLTISVIESGVIKARDQVIIKSQVEGRTSIITLIPEGTQVKKGDLLVELDSSSLLDKKIDQEIRVQNGEAAFISATENLAVVKNQAESDKDKAKLTLDFSEQDLKKYLEGEYPNQLKEAEAKIILAREELTRAREKLKWSKILYEEKYISDTELQGDKLAENKRDLDLQLAQNDLQLLKDFTYKRDLAQLESDVSQATMALERTMRKTKADIIQAEADLRAKEAEYNRQKDKLEKTEDQIVKTKIYAPADGLAIHATSARSGGFRHSVEPLDEGQEVRERQELIYLPTAASTKAEVAIHESSLKKIRPGLPAIITIDALPGKRFTGTVERIAPLPDAQSMWMNPDLKVYNTDIYLDDNDGGLRTGMSCKAEIIIERYDDVVYIPVQAVLRVGGESTVYIANGKSLVPRKVQIGLDNNRMIRIISGLQAGEVVSLTPPLKSAAVEAADYDIVTKTISAEKQETRHKPEPEESQQEDKPDGEMEKTRERFRNMSEEEREKMRQRFQNMSPEEREKMRQARDRSPTSNEADR